MAMKFAMLGLAAALALGATSAQAAGDAAAGKTFFNGICAMCHNAAKGAPNKIGPNLWGIVGSKPGTVPGFNFSPAMKAAKFSWTEQNLADYINNPQAKIPGNRMPYGGTHSMQKAQNVAAYLATLK
jgi:cytochrome c